MKMHYSFRLGDWGWECGFGPDLVYREPVGTPFCLWLRVRQVSKGFNVLLTYSVLMRWNQN